LSNQAKEKKKKTDEPCLFPLVIKACVTPWQSPGVCTGATLDPILAADVTRYRRSVVMSATWSRVRAFPTFFFQREGGFLSGTDASTLHATIKLLTSQVSTSLFR